jgi:hypothetical protein
LFYPRSKQDTAVNQHCEPHPALFLDDPGLPGGHFSDCWHVGGTLLPAHVLEPLVREAKRIRYSEFARATPNNRSCGASYVSRETVPVTGCTQGATPAKNRAGANSCAGSGPVADFARGPPSGGAQMPLPPHCRVPPSSRSDFVARHSPANSIRLPAS